MVSGGNTHWTTYYSIFRDLLETGNGLTFLPSGLCVRNARSFAEKANPAVAANMLPIVNT